MPGFKYFLDITDLKRPAHIRGTYVRHLPTAEKDASYQDYSDVV